METRLTLNKTILNWKSNGIFHNLGLFDVPWKNDVSDKTLDFRYHGNHSGMKKISPLIENLLDDNSVLTDDDVRLLASIIFESYEIQWKKLYDTMKFEYNPIENYSMVETTTQDSSNTGTVSTTNNISYGKQNDINETSSNTGTVTEESTLTKNTTQKTTNDLTNTDNCTDTKKSTVTNDLVNTSDISVVYTPTETIIKDITNSDNTQNNVFGFDSTESVSDNESSSNGTSKETENHSGTNTTTTVQTDKNVGTVVTDDSLTNSLTHKQTGTVDVTNSGSDSNNNKRTDNLSYTKSVTDTSSGNDTENNTRTDDLQNHMSQTLKRSGNIGVTTSQQMIESERQLWLWKYFDVIFKDVDSLLTIAIY